MLRYVPSFSQIQPHLPSIPHSLSELACSALRLITLAGFTKKNEFELNAASTLLPIISEIACLPTVAATPLDVSSSLSFADLQMKALDNAKEKEILIENVDEVIIGNSKDNQRKRRAYSELAIEGESRTSTFLTSLEAGIGFAYSGVQTPEGEYYTTGHISNVGAGGLDIFINKYFTNGTVAWTKTLGGANPDQSYSINLLSNSNLQISGFTRSHTDNTGDMLIATFSPNGTLISAKTFGFPGTLEVANKIQQTQDGGTIAAGYTGGGSSITFDALIAKFSANGTLSWFNTVGTVKNDNFASVIEMEDQGYVAVGQTNGMLGNADATNMLISKFLSNGTLSQTIAIDGQQFDALTDIKKTSDNGFVVSGYTNSTGAGKNDIVIAKLTENLTLSWMKTIGGLGDDIGRSIYVTPSNKFMVTGSITGFTTPNITDMLVAQFSENGALEWATAITNARGPGTAYFGKITNDGGIIIGGSLSQHVFAKLDKNGKMLNCNMTQSIYPTVTDVTNFMRLSSPLFNFTTRAPIVQDWSIATVNQRLTETSNCSANTLSFSPSNSDQVSSSMTILETPTAEITDTVIAAIDKGLLVIESSDLSITGILNLQISPSGNIILVQTNATVQLVQVTDNSVMTLAGDLTLPDSRHVSAFTQDEQYLFVANNQSMIEVINIKNPSKLSSVGFTTTKSSIYSLCVSGDNQALLVGTQSGISLLSLAKPDLPETITEIATYPTLNAVVSIQTNPHDPTIVVVGSGNSLSLLRLMNNVLTVLDQTTFPQPIQSVSPLDFVDPTQLTVTLINHDMVFINISNPTAITEISTFPGASSELMTASGATLLVSGAKPGIQIFNNQRKNWQTPFEVGYSPVLGSVTNLLFSQDGGYVAYSDEQGIKLISLLKKPGRLDVPLPQLSLVAKLGFAIQDVLLNEENEWIAVSNENQLNLLSTKNLALPTFLSTLNTNTDILQMILFPDKTKLLLVEKNVVTYVDCFNANALQVMGTWNTSQPINSATLTGTYLYVCQGNAGISVLDITNPSAITDAATLATEATVQSIVFNPAQSLAFVAKSTGIDIWTLKTPSTYQRISQFNISGYISHLALSPDKKTLYFSNEDIFGQLNVSNPWSPSLAKHFDVPRPIKNIVLSSEGNVAYLADENAGMMIVNTKTMQVQNQFSATAVNAMALTKSESVIYVADDVGGLKVVNLLTELPIIPLTTPATCSAAVSVERNLLFFDAKMQPISAQINSIYYVNNGQKEGLPFWISADLTQQTLSITAPKEFTDQIITLALSIDVNGVEQETLYQTQVSSSLVINTNKGVVSITTPSPTVSVSVNLTQAHFVPQAGGALSVAIADNILRISGLVSDVNAYLAAIRINPNPLSLAPSDVLMNTAEITAVDLVNLSPSTVLTPLRNFRFNQPPIAIDTLNQTTVAALSAFNVSFSVSDYFYDPDDATLILSAQSKNGTALPTWLNFKFDATNPTKILFSGYPPASLTNTSIDVVLTASDGSYAASTYGKFFIKPNRGPVSTSVAGATFESSSPFNFNLPLGAISSPENNTLAFSAVQIGYPALPGFLVFSYNLDVASNQYMITAQGQPTSNDVNGYTINITGTDKFGASASLIWDVNIEYSKLDFIFYLLNLVGLMAPVITPFTAAFVARSFLYNTLKQKQYWREEIPTDLRNGIGYHPKTLGENETIIPEEKIKKIHVMRLDKKKCGHDVAKKWLPTYWYILLFSKKLVNEELLPAWLTRDPINGALTLIPSHFPDNNSDYVFQVIGRHCLIPAVILESFIINLASIGADKLPLLTFALSNSLSFEPETSGEQGESATAESNSLDISNEESILAMNTTEPMILFSDDDVVVETTVSSVAIAMLNKQEAFSDKDSDSDESVDKGNNLLLHYARIFNRQSEKVEEVSEKQVDRILSEMPPR